MSAHNPDECPLCSGSGEVTITPFGADDGKADSYGCPACIAADRDKAEQQRDKLLAVLENLLAITNDSQGVAGYHLNGDVAQWGEFPEVAEADAVIAEVKGQS